MMSIGTQFAEIVLGRLSSYAKNHGAEAIGDLLETAGDVGVKAYEELKDEVENHPLETCLSIIAVAAVPM